MIVPVLPHDHRVFAELTFIVFGSMPRVNEEPHEVAMPKSFLGVVGIFFLVCPSMVTNVIGRPPKRGVLECPSSGDEQQRFHPWVTFKAAMRNEAVVADRDA